MARSSYGLRKPSVQRGSSRVSASFAVGEKRRRLPPKAAKGRILPHELSLELSAFWQKNVKRLKGLGWIAAGIILFLSLLTYHPSDPSWNLASSGVPQNLFSTQGAYVADFFFQFLGSIAFIIPLFLVFWGGWSLRTTVTLQRKRRLWAFLAGFVILTTASAYWGGKGFSVYGTLHGTLGVVLARALSLGLPPLILWPLSILLAVGGSALMAYGFVVRWQSLLSMGHRFSSWGSSARAWANRQEPSSFPKPVFTLDPSLRDKRQPVFSSKGEEASEELAEEFSKEFLEEEPLLGESREIYQREVTAAVSAEASYKEILASLKSMEEDYALPPVALLDKTVAPKQQKAMSLETLDKLAGHLHDVLEEFGVRGEITDAKAGPVVTLYELKPAAGIKTSRVIGLADDIARSMSALSARIAVIPGRNVIGIELPNPQKETVYMRELLESTAFDESTAALPLILGKDIGGHPAVVDLARMPHLLVAGTTGSGKSVSINTMILSLLYRLTPELCKFIMIDPKMLELSVYDGIPHLLCPVVTDPKKAVVALRWAVKEMESRYRAMAKLGVRNIDGYNMRLKENQAKGELMMRRVQTGFDPDSGKPIFENQPLELEFLPYIVIVVDEMADLMMVAGKEIEIAVQRLAQMARAAGIHLIMATQRPSVDVITGTIKANFPTRMSFQVTSKIDSRTILGEQGAEQLLGQGDMLYMAGGGRITRLHGPFVRDDEVERVVKFLKTQGEPTYLEEVTQDDGLLEEGVSEESAGDSLYNQAVELVLREGKASTSFVQRHLQLGYNRAAKLIEQMEKEGIVSPANHVGKREILRS